MTLPLGPAWAGRIGSNVNLDTQSRVSGFVLRNLRQCTQCTPRALRWYGELIPAPVKFGIWF
eukprot:8741751-Pyramimonas_sp.AAC.1